MDETELLIKDLCARAPYDTIVSVADFTEDKVTWNKEKLTLYLLHRIEEEEGAWGFIKPYLRSMDDMTEEELAEYEKANDLDTLDSSETLRENMKAERRVRISKWYHGTDWLNAHHFDYRGLIEKGLAIKAPKGMYKV